MCTCYFTSFWSAAMAVRLGAGDWPTLYLFYRRAWRFPILLSLVLLMTRVVDCQDDFATLIELQKELNFPPSLSVWTGATNQLCNSKSSSRSDDVPLVVCDPLTNRVTILNLQNLGLTGPIPKSIFNLTKLQTLTVRGNNFTGQIPEDVARLPELSVLTFNLNQLSGPIPYEIGNLKNLALLGMDNNGISGPLPTSIGSLSSLKTLNLQKNSITGSIPHEIGNLRKLEELSLQENQFSGEIPVEIGSLVNLKEIYLFDNRLMGSIPASFGNLANLTTLDFRNNSLNGNIPPELGNMSSLTSMTLNSNNLTGSLPEELGKLSLLTKVKFNENRFMGRIPLSFANLTKLEDFQVQANNFAGEIPPMFAEIFANGGSNKRPRFARNWFNNSGLVTNSNYKPYLTDELSQNCLTGDSLTNQKPDIECATFYNRNFQNNTDLCVECPAKRVFVYDGYCKCLFPTELQLSVYAANFSANIFMRAVARGLVLPPEQVVKSDPPMLGLQSPDGSFNVTVWLVPRKGDSFTEDEVSFWRQNFTSYGIPIYDPQTNITFTYQFLSIRRLMEFDPIVDQDIPLPTKKNESRRGRALLVGLVVTFSIAFAFALGLAVFFAVRTRQLSKGQSEQQALLKGENTKKGGTHTITSWGTYTGSASDPIEFNYKPTRPFSIKELIEATDNFAEERVIGKGGFGWVYRATLEGEEVAVKRSNRYKQFLPGANQFKTEVELLWRVHHRNLVRLVGYCDEDDSLMLIYKFMANGSLADHIKGKDRPSLTWQQRLSIGVEAARGLHYLHKEAWPPVIHRDIKPDNILLDENMKAGLSDLGISRLFDAEETHITTQVAGTFGYLDPEYMTTRRLTDKSDVYSFGIVLLQLVTGRHKASRDEPLGIEQMILEEFNSGGIEGIVDKRLDGVYPKKTFERVIYLGLKCARPTRAERPGMEVVLRELEMCQDTAREEMPEHGIQGLQAAGKNLQGEIEMSASSLKSREKKNIIQTTEEGATTSTFSTLEHTMITFHTPGEFIVPR